MSLADLGRRAVACKHWRWMPGMYLLPHLDGCECCEDRNFPRRAARLPAVFTTEIDVPDLSDPATLGCLLHLVRQAYGDSSLQPNDAGEYDMLHWHVFIGPHFACTGHATEAEALVAALEAAP
jgi:hypothetical protein